MSEKFIKSDKVSCLIVTADRKRLLRRSLESYKNQSHRNREIVIIDNGVEPVDDLLQDFNSEEVVYVKIEPSPDNILGELRNISLEHAKGDYMICWDDDDWFHPDRIKIQLDALKDGFDACCLEGNLFHINADEYSEYPYIGSLPGGSPSSIIHRRDDNIKYPSMNREEDTVYLNEWKMKKRYRQLDLSYSYLFVRVFHGTNVSGKRHFLRRLKNSPESWIQYFWHSKIKRNLFGHPKFSLSKKERESFEMFVRDSEKFGLL